MHLQCDQDLTAIRPLLSETGRLRNQSPEGGKECDRRREKKKPDHKNIKGQ